jgi:Leucine-rich repeat (LRR) protein
LTQLEILVVSHHKLSTLKEVENLRGLISLFLFNNEITSLEGVEHLKTLEQLYVHCNKINSLLPLKSLTQLKELYVNFNDLNSFEGITAKHSRNMKTFFCLPNDKITFKDVMQFERKVGIRCTGLKG